ncbi:SprT-like domain-containing protein [Singulisphaera sp. PoT]|uniref:SprT-like domain-containing protein n=1 Tax=Singulisphaera sp. PoT TaxID=3411797 RepID=UPI003BF5785C
MDLKELVDIAGSEIKSHGLRGWTFALANTKRRLGVCKYQSKRIEISEFHASNNPASVVLDTLRHEIAHAIAGPAARHGPVWKAVALRLGAKPRACDNSRETVLSPGQWQATCPTCHHTFHRYRRPTSLNGYRCRCKGRSPLVFEFKGDPALEPLVPQTLEESARWEARCAGCDRLHLRTRRPKAGLWRCKCPHGSELTWRARQGLA